MGKNEKTAGYFVAIEGGEGVGKTTFVTLLCERLQALGKNFLRTREPGGSPTADRMRQIFVAPEKLDPLTMRAEILLVSAARAQHVERVIAPALRAGQLVICDRFADSTRVYQGLLGGVAEATIDELTDFATGGLSPHVSFLLDASYEVVAERLSARARAGGEITRYDQSSEAFHRKLLAAYRQVATKYRERFCLLDAEQLTEKTVQQALDALHARGIL